MCILIASIQNARCELNWFLFAFKIKYDVAFISFILYLLIIVSDISFIIVGCFLDIASISFIFYLLIMVSETYLVKVLAQQCYLENFDHSTTFNALSADKSQ